jgi:hypothetical protein
MENNRDKAEKQSLKDKLMAIILLESEKDYREMDSELIKECVDFLMELDGEEGLSKKEIEQRVAAIPFKGKVTAISSYAKKKMRAKRLAVVAAVLAFIIALFGILAIASGDTTSELLRQVGQTIHSWFEGGSVDYGDITVIKPDGTKTYSSLEKLEESENLNILYPTWLPKNEKIISIVYFNEGESESYVLQSNNPYHSIEIKLNNNLSESLKLNCIRKEISGLTVYYIKTEQYIQAIFNYNNNRYDVHSDTEDNLFRIIENLKEIN